MENFLPIICKKRKAGMALLQCTPFPLSFLFCRHLYYCQNFPILFQRSGVGRAHKRQLIQGLICHAKNLKKMYKILSHGYTVSRKAYSTTTESYIRQQNLTYLFLIRKIYFPKDTRFFTASVLCKPLLVVRGLLY